MPNRLASETSPYLLQHADNPVDWYPWGDEAFARAREEDKPLLVSIGYAACHWCHVMERESFEDAAVAALMNESFVCIKVDREERPDVDAIYMDAVQAMTGSGGWPLNAFLTPGGRAVLCGHVLPAGAAARAAGVDATCCGRSPRRGCEQRAEIEESAGRILPRLAGAAALEAPGGEVSDRALDRGGRRPCAARSTRRTAAGAGRRSSRRLR